MYIGIDIGGSHIAVGLVDKNNIILEKKEHNWNEEEKKDFRTTIIFYAKKLIEDIIINNKIKIEKIGIAYPNKNIINGIIYLNDGEFDLIGILSKEFDVPIYLKNDVKCSAICEKNIGNLNKYNNCLFMTLGTGIGGAYFYKNELVSPNTYQGFEIGHMIINVGGKQCRCGQKGCFEEYASMRMFRKDIADLFNIEKVTSYKMFEILKSKEKSKEVNEIIEKYINYLAVGICNLINIFEPDCICIGGSFAYYQSIFMDKLKEKVKKNFPNRAVPDLLVAKYANDAGIIGAAMLQSN